MPLSFTTTQNPGSSYVDIRVGEGHGIHQMQLAAALTADADGLIPVGTPVDNTGAAVPATAGSKAFAFVGPEPVKKNAAGVTPGNVILTGVLNRDAIEDNLGRVLTATEADVVAGLRLL